VQKEDKAMTLDVNSKEYCGLGMFIMQILSPALHMLPLSIS